MKNILIAGSSKNLGFYIKNSLSKSFNVISLSSKIKTIEKKILLIVICQTKELQNRYY